VVQWQVRNLFSDRSLITVCKAIYLLLSCVNSSHSIFLIGSQYSKPWGLGEGAASLSSRDRLWQARAYLHILHPQSLWLVTGCTHNSGYTNQDKSTFWDFKLWNEQILPIWMWKFLENMPGTVLRFNSSMIYLIYCKNLCKYHNVPLPSTTIKWK
jgi:hypothetical protein